MTKTWADHEYEEEVRYQRAERRAVMILTAVLLIVLLIGWLFG